MEKRWSGTTPWCEPDLFVLKDLRLEKVVEVIVKEGYRRTKEKVNKIRDWLKPLNVEIVVFKPIIYLDKHKLQENLYHYAQKCGFEPKSYKELDKWHADKWRKEGLEVIFWNEQQLVVK